jgi:hypothetical protein
MGDREDARDERRQPPRLMFSKAREREALRMRANDVIAASFPPPEEATSDQLAEMAMAVLGFDGRGLAAALGINRAEGETLLRSPTKLSARQRAMLAQFLEMKADARTDERSRAIAARLRRLVKDEQTR